MRALVCPSLVVAGLISCQSADDPSSDLTLGAQVPMGFVDEGVVTIPQPTALAFLRDGRILAAEKTGALRVISNGQLRATAAIDLAPALCTNSERGLLGVAVDPEFATNHYVYLYYTHDKFDSCATNSAASPINRVSRFVLSETSTIDPASELVLVDNIPSPNGNHNAGDLHFGADGLLYISVGDGGCALGDASSCAGQNGNARSRSHLLGKLLRIRADGSIPPTNPFAGAPGSRRCGDPAGVPAGTGHCQETFAWGLRNPFRFAIRPSNGEIFVNDVGQEIWEEIDRIEPGADYGWNLREGNCARNSATDCGSPPVGATNPIHQYDHSTGCKSITGGAFVPPSTWPSAFDGAYLFADYVCGKIFALTENGNGFARTEFASGLGNSSVAALGFGPDGWLYYTTFANGGELRRIRHVGAGNRTPVAHFRATPVFGVAPLAVQFDASESADADAGDALTYRWSFGDGSAPVETTQPTIGHTFAARGNRDVSLRVRDNHGATSTPAVVRVFAGDLPPAPTIVSPAAGATFRVGQLVQLAGSATDPEDGNVPAARLSWTVLLHHNDHTHPLIGPVTGATVSFTAPPPEDLDATDESFLEVRLTATDAAGLSATVVRDLQPHRVPVMFTSTPSGRAIEINGGTRKTPFTVTSWEGYALTVGAPPQVTANGLALDLASWSDGGAPSHRIATPAQPATITATFATGGTGNGLFAEYHARADLGDLRAVRFDARVAFDFGGGPPTATIGADHFSIRWSGEVAPRASEVVTFITRSDDGVRFWVDGRLLIDDWTSHGPLERSATVALEAGRRYPIVLEYFDDAFGASIELAWQTPTHPREIIPQDRLFARPRARINFQPEGAAVPLGTLADTGALYGPRPSGHSYGWTADIRAGARDRNSPFSLDQRYDTLLHMQQLGAATWELAVPPGNYAVRVVAGDAATFDSVYAIDIEGRRAVSATPTTSTRWHEGSVVVRVSDGRLTVGNGTGAANNKICFIEIDPK